MIAQELMREIDNGIKNMKKTEKKKTYGFLVRPSLMNEVRKIAKEEGIYISDLLEYLLEMYLDNQECIDDEDK